MDLVSVERHSFERLRRLPLGVRAGNSNLAKVYNYAIEMYQHEDNADLMPLYGRKMKPSVGNLA